MDRVLLMLMMIDGYNQIINESEICNDYSLRDTFDGIRLLVHLPNYVLIAMVIDQCK